MKKIIVVCASNNKNLELSKKIESEVKNQGGEPLLLDLVDLNLSLSF